MALGVPVHGNGERERERGGGGGGGEEERNNLVVYLFSSLSNMSTCRSMHKKN